MNLDYLAIDIIIKCIAQGIIALYLRRRVRTVHIYKFSKLKIRYLPVIEQLCAVCIHIYQRYAKKFIIVESINHAG